jgi:hypothetical protein
MPALTSNSTFQNQERFEAYSDFKLLASLTSPLSSNNQLDIHPSVPQSSQSIDRHPLGFENLKYQCSCVGVNSRSLVMLDTG